MTDGLNPALARAREAAPPPSRRPQNYRNQISLVVSYSYIAWAALSDNEYTGFYKGWRAYRTSTKCGNNCDGGVNLDLSSLGVLDVPTLSAPNATGAPRQLFSSPEPIARGTGNGTTSYALKDGIERFLITDSNNPAGSVEAQSNIAIYFDTFGVDSTSTGVAHAQLQVFNHLPGGCNVLYMDGHVEFLKYSSYPNENWPMTEFLGALGVGGDR